MLRNTSLSLYGYLLISLLLCCGKEQVGMDSARTRVQIEQARRSEREGEMAREEQRRASEREAYWHRHNVSYALPLTEAKRRLITEALYKIREDEVDEACVICMDGDPKPYKNRCCNSFYHECCLRKHFETQLSHQLFLSCPYCRRDPLAWERAREERLERARADRAERERRESERAEDQRAEAEARERARANRAESARWESERAANLGRAQAMYHHYSALSYNQPITEERQGFITQILDELRGDEVDEMCIICQEIINSDIPDPKPYKNGCCNHCYHESCLRKHFETQLSSRSFVFCPTCKRTWHLP